jgi:hypothetical protein
MVKTKMAGVWVSRFYNLRYHCDQENLVCLHTVREKKTLCKEGKRFAIARTTHNICKYCTKLISPDKREFFCFFLSKENDKFPLFILGYCCQEIWCDHSCAA